MEKRNTCEERIGETDMKERERERERDRGGGVPCSAVDYQDLQRRCQNLLLANRPTSIIPFPVNTKRSIKERRRKQRGERGRGESLFYLLNCFHYVVDLLPMVPHYIVSQVLQAHLFLLSLSITLLSMLYMLLLL